MLQLNHADSWDPPPCIIGAKKTHCCESTEQCSKHHTGSRTSQFRTRPIIVCYAVQCLHEVFFYARHIVEGGNPAASCLLCTRRHDQNRAYSRFIVFLLLLFSPQVRKTELDRELSRWLRTLALIRRKDGDVVDTSQVFHKHACLPIYVWKPTITMENDMPI